MGKRTAQKDTIIDITSDSQVNSNFPYRWSPASLTFNNYFYLFLYYIIILLYTRHIANHQGTKTEEPPWDGQQKKLLGGGGGGGGGGLQLVCGRPTLALSSALVPQTLNGLVCVENF